jgi:hypothetical protein
VGGGLGNAVLFSIGPRSRRGSRVLYFAGYKKLDDRYKVDEIEAAADEVVWCCDEGTGLRAATRAGQDLRRQYRRGHGGARRGKLGPVRSACRTRPGDRDRFRRNDGRGSARAPRHPRAVPQAGARRARLDQLADAMHDEGDLRAVPAAARGSATGKTTYVFLCFNQDQPLDAVDFAGLRARLGQNTLQEKLTAQWIDRELRALGTRA